jgi:CheY-like chemotaxis protein
MSKKILLADDSLTIQKVVELTLAGADYELTCVSNGQKALASLEHSRPDLILADVVMPEKNGYEVCEAVKSNPATARIPVVLLSGTFEPFDRERADRVGADRIVSKPFDAQHLLEELEALLKSAATASSPPSALEEGPFDTAFLDDTVPTLRAAEALGRESPFEPLPPLPSVFEPRTTSREEGEAPPSEAPAGEGETPARAGTIDESPVLSFVPSIAATLEEAPAIGEEPETRHPVEEIPALQTPPAEPPAGEAAVEEISAEAAEPVIDAPAAPPQAAPAPPAPAVTELTQEQFERIAALVVAKLSDRVLREIVWEVVPDVAERVVKRRIEELESGAE